MKPSAAKEYRAWKRIQDRCFNKKHHHYKYYGAKGITVCERWKNSYDAFLSDMGPAPSQMHSIDRLNNLEGYSSQNCRWATAKQQCRNRSSNLIISYRGEKMPLKALCEKYGKKYWLIWQRIRRDKMTIERAMA